MERVTLPKELAERNRISLKEHKVEEARKGTHKTESSRRFLSSHLSRRNKKTDQGINGLEGKSINRLRGGERALGGGKTESTCTGTES